MNNDSISMELSIEEANLILEGLGELPFRRVFQLIGRIQSAARAQIEPAGDAPVSPNGHAAATTVAISEEVPA
jgi:hypothetical protein